MSEPKPINCKFCVWLDSKEQKCKLYGKFLSAIGNYIKPCVICSQLKYDQAIYSSKKVREVL